MAVKIISAHLGLIPGSCVLAIIP